MQKHNIPNRIAELRAAKGWTQDRLSLESGVHRVTLARYETGAVNMTIESAAKIANALGCKIDTLYNRE